MNTVTTTPTNTVTTTTKKAEKAVNPYLAVLAQETAKIEADAQKAIEKQLHKMQENNRLLVEAVCLNLNQDLSEESQEFYSLMTAAYSTESIAEASGKILAEKVIAMIGQYYAGNKSALDPVLTAAHIWVQAKHNGVIKTENVNKLRLLVTRHSYAKAKEIGAEFKFTLSCGKNENGSAVFIIKEKPMKEAVSKSEAQKVFEQILKLKEKGQLDELISLTATDAALVSSFAMIAAIDNGKIEAITKEGLRELENRKHAASEKEDALQESLDQATENKLQLADELGDAQDALAENEIALTAKREQLDTLNGKFKRARNEDTKKQLSEELLIVNAQLEDLLAVNAELTANVHNIQKRLDKAQAHMDKVSREYDAQAQLVVELAKQAEKVRAQLAH